MLNTYTTEFFGYCPNNGVRIHYRLRIETVSVIRVEDILIFVRDVTGYHEAIADDLLAQFGGKQTLSAYHHGVTIETSRTTA